LLPAVLLALAMSALRLQAFAATPPKELLAAGRVDEAIATLQTRIDHSATDAESYNLLCRAYFMLEEWDRGISACERARNLNPQSGLYYLWLGRIYGEKADRAGFFSAAGLAKKVRLAFERAVELNPQNWEARADLAEFYVGAPGIAGGGREKAQAQANVIAPIKPAIAHWIAARIAAKDHDSAAAEREYRAAIAADPSVGRSWVDLAGLLRYNKRLDDMEEVLRNLESTPVEQREALMDGASILLRTGRDFPLAVRLLQRYLSSPVEEGPAFKAHDLLGHLLEKQGNRDAAAREYRAALALAHNYAHAREDLKRMQS
jgi:tetratricopeptide (TPR) repeat protein